MQGEEYITHSAEETVVLGRKLAPTLTNARMVILRGDLGAGKTTLVKGIAEGLHAASPGHVVSFAHMKRRAGVAHNPSLTRLCHYYIP